jgi:hypothetical protein
MKKRNRLFGIDNPKKTNRIKNKNENKNKDLSVYSYKCGHKNIKLTVKKVEEFKSSEAFNSIFYYSCPFCNKDFDRQIQICPDCSQSLVKINLKKCPQCGSKNNPFKQTCWVCNASFPVLELKPEKENRWLLTLNVDGVYFRNNDIALNPRMKKLFEDLITVGFSKEPLEAWAKAYEDDVEFKKDLLKEKCKYLAQESKRRSFVYIAIAILVITISLLIIKVFWSN